MKQKIKDIHNNAVGEIDLLEGIFAQEARPDILHRVVRWQQAKARSGNHQTKTISMVQGSTRKPFRQKGTGRARQGTIRAPQHRGGAVVFGPQVRDHAFDLPKKVRKLGLKVALSSKLTDGNLIIVESLQLKDAKTKELREVLKKNNWDSVLFIDGEKVDEGFARASQNIVGIDVLPQQGANVYSILQHKTLILTKDAVHHLEARLK